MPPYTFNRVSQKLRKHSPIPVLLALFVLLPFWDLLWTPETQVVAGNDLLFMFLPWWRFAQESLRQGEFPLWNPYLFSGVPFLANPQPALFYPPVWLIGLLPLTRAAGLLFFLHLWLAGLGTYGWLRAEGADRWGSLFGAVAFAFNGYFAVRIYGGHLGVVMTQAWLPVVLWAARRAIEGRSLRRAVLGGLPVALSLLAGHTASFLYVGLVLAAYALYLAWRAWRQAPTPASGWASLRTGLLPLLLTGTMVLTGLGLAAVQLLPTWELVRHSVRQEASYTFAAQYAWPPGYLLTLLVPNFFGEPVRAGYWGVEIYTEFIFYTGLLPLLLALALGSRLRHRLVPFLLLLAGAGLLLAMGPATILHRLAYDFLPLFRSTRAPARAGFLFAFAVAALSGLALTRMHQRPDEARSALRGWVQGPLPWLVGTLAVLVTLTGFLLFGLQRDSNAQVGRLWHVANYVALFLLFFLLAVGLVRAWLAGRVTGRQGATLAIGLVLLDLWSFGRPLIQTVPATESGYWRTVAQVVGEAGRAGRVLPWGLTIFEHNQGMVLGLESVFGYDPLELERYYRFTTAVSDPRARAYDLLGARYLVTGQEMTFPDEADAPRLLAHRGDLWVYERPTAFPPAWLVHRAEVLSAEEVLARLNDPAFDPRQVALLEADPPCTPTGAEGPAPEGEAVRFSRQGNNRLEVEVEAASEGLLVLGEVFYPGWRATVDGKPAPVLRADYALRAVCVPAGTHRITLTFAPLSFRLGAGISLLSLLLLVVALFWGRR